MVQLQGQTKQDDRKDGRTNGSSLTQGSLTHSFFEWRQYGRSEEVVDSDAMLNERKRMFMN
jgi:hypothetical protein